MIYYFHTGWYCYFPRCVVDRRKRHSDGSIYDFCSADHAREFSKYKCILDSLDYRQMPSTSPFSIQVQNTVCCPDVAIGDVKITIFVPENIIRKQLDKVGS